MKFIIGTVIAILIFVYYKVYFVTAPYKKIEVGEYFVYHSILYRKQNFGESIQITGFITPFERMFAPVFLTLKDATRVHPR